MESIDTNLRVVRLTTGDDIMAEVTVFEHTNGKTYSLRNALRIMYVMGKDGNSITVAMIEWIFPRVSNQEEIRIDASNVLFEAIPTKAIQEYYWNYLDQTEVRTTELDELDNSSDEDSNIPYVMEMLEELKKKGGKLN
jgi:hypothetical protein